MIWSIEMKSLKWMLATSIALAMTGLTPSAQAAATGNSPGYYYIAASNTGGGSPGTYQFMSVGAFSTQAACMQAKAADFANGGAWNPYGGTGIQCTYVYANEVGSMNDVLSHWNTVADGSNGTTLGYLDHEKLKTVAELRDIYFVESYEADMVRILQER